MAALVALPGAASAQTTTQITLPEAMQAAAGGHPAIERAEQARAAARSQRKQAKSNYGPQLVTEANLFVWNEELVFGGLAPSDGPVELPEPTTPYEAIVAGLVNAEPTVIREQVTWDFTVRLIQPISSLWAISYGVEATRLAEDSADIEIAEAKRAQVRDAIVGYFRVLQAAASVETARLAVEQLEAQGKQVEALVETGTVQSGEKLRIDVALAASRQNLLRAEAGLELARAGLALAVNEPAGARVGAAPWRTDELPGADEDLGAAIADSMANRPELDRLVVAQQQADIGVLAEKANYVPQLSALAQYQHTEGQGLAGADNAFVGLNFSWTVFQWGGRKHAIDVAQAQRLQLDSTLELTRRQIAIQVEQTWRNLHTSIASHAVAQSAVEQATEAYRVAAAQFEVGRTTATDLLSAQTALTEAQNNQNAALFEAWVNKAELTYATGRPLQGFGANR